MRIVPWKGIPSEHHVVLADVWDHLPALPKGFPRPVLAEPLQLQELFASTNSLCCVYNKCVYCVVVFHLSVTCGPIFFLLVWL